MKILRFLLCPFYILFVVYKAGQVLCEEVIYKMKKYFYKSKPGSYGHLLEELRSNEEHLQLLKEAIATRRMMNKLTFRDKINIRLGRLSWPRVYVSEDINSMTAEEVLMELEKQ